ncbi:MAG TPA: DUF4340 domain-containing protein [Gammaproteobacteria bacterium]
MNRKNLLILSLIAGVCIVLAVAGRLGDGSGPIAGESAGTLFLQGLTRDLDQVDQILIDGPGSERLVSLDRTEAGWVVAELGNYPAERTQINGLLIALGEARILEEKTADPEFHSRLGVEAIAAPDAAGIEVSLSSGDAGRWTAVIGDRYGGTQRYARISSSDRSVLIDRDPEIPTDPADWVFEQIIDVAASRIQQVEIAHQDGDSLILSKDALTDSDFSVVQIPADRELQYAGIANVTGGLLEGLDLEEVQPRPAEPSAEPVAVIDFRTFDGLVVRVTAEAGDDEDAWLSFSASFDADQAAAFAAAADQDSGGGEADATDAAAADTAEASDINARLSGWRYRIPSYKYSQLTRRMEDLLQAVTDE